VISGEAMTGAMPVAGVMPPPEMNVIIKHKRIKV
jgi:hypothetical protein